MIHMRLGRRCQIDKVTPVGIQERGLGERKQSNSRLVCRVSYMKLQMFRGLIGRR